MHVEERGLICDTSKRPASETAAAFVGLSATESGILFCVFQIGPAKNSPSSTLLVYRSRDQGRSWQELKFGFETKINGIPGALTCGQIAEAEPGKLLLVATWFDRSQAAQPFFDPVTEGILPSKQLTAFSTDEGETWSAWEILVTPKLQACSSTGPLLKWADGLIGFPFENLKQFDDPNPAVPGAWCMLSKDRGQNFELPTLVARDPMNKIYFWDQRLSPGRNPGEFIGLFWTYDREKQQDLKVHCLRSSFFGDASKARPFPTTLTGQIASPLWLGNGRLVAFVVERSCPGTLALWSSDDEGISWPENLVVYRHEESLDASPSTDYVQYWKKWESGVLDIQLFCPLENKKFYSLIMRGSRIEQASIGRE